MSKKLQTGTTKGQRIAIILILIFTVISTAGLYAGMVLSQKNSQQESKKQQEKNEELRKAFSEYQAKVKAQGDELSKKYYETFKEFKNTPAAFNSGSVKELSTKDLREGDGEEFNEKTTEFAAYYIGWKPDGAVFDGSFDENGLKPPFTAEKTDETWRLIEGWPEGMKGMKVGGIREISIPAEKAYGAQGSPNPEDPAKSIPENTPLKFVIFLIPKFEKIPEPDLSKYNLGA